MAVVVDAATYDVVEQDARALGIADAPADGPGSKILIVYKRVGSRWRKWVAVTRSCALASVGINALGLYTLQDLRYHRVQAVDLWWGGEEPRPALQISIKLMVLSVEARTRHPLSRTSAHEAAPRRG